MSCYVDFEPHGLRIECASGMLLSEIAREAGIGLLSVCGNNGLCGRCRVQIVSGTVSPVTEVEKELLGTDDIAGGYRLACRISVLKNAKILIPSSSLVTAQKLEMVGQEPAIPFDPPV